MRSSLLALLMFCGPALIAQNNWYVDNQSGKNGNDGLSPNAAVQTVEHLTKDDLVLPGDTIWIMGEYHNPSYDPDFVYGGDSDRNNPHIWHAENTIRVNRLNGAPGQYITFKPYNENTVLKGDGGNIFRVSNSSYLRIEGFEIYGEVENIPLSSAEGVETEGMQFLYLDPATANPERPTLEEVLLRVPAGTSVAQIETMSFPLLGGVDRPSYTDTRGLYVSDSDHIDLLDNRIHHMPGGGLRVADCADVRILGNEIHDCSRRSFSGTHGLVVTKTKPGSAADPDPTTYSIVLANNLVHHNYNEVFSWNGNKDFITPRIDEGKGIAILRNDGSSWENSGQRILAENNVCYWNGFSGLHANDSWQVDFFNNTCYLNSYTNTVTYANDQRGNNIGISAQGGGDYRIINNLVVVDAAWGGFALSAAGTGALQVANNLIFGQNGTLQQDDQVSALAVNTTVADPLLSDPEGSDFTLQANSPAIGAADPAYASEFDYFGNSRDLAPDLGAIEFIATTNVRQAGPDEISVYPNPFSDRVILEGPGVETGPISLYNALGQEVRELSFSVRSTGKIEIHLANLPEGLYILSGKDFRKKLYKSSTSF